MLRHWATEIRFDFKPDSSIICARYPHHIDAFLLARAPSVTLRVPPPSRMEALLYHGFGEQRQGLDEIFAEMKMNDEEKNEAAFRLPDGGFAGDS